MATRVSEVLTYEVREAILGCLRMGNFRKVAAQLAGISPKLLDTYLQRGEELAEAEPDFDQLPDDDEVKLLAAFYVRVARVEAEAEAQIVRRWRKQTVGDWHAGATFLKSRYRDRWGEKQEIQLSGRIDHTNRVDVTKLSDEELTALEQMVKKSTGADE